MHTPMAWLAAVVTPVILIGLGVGAVLLPAFPTLEYRRASFPPDPYGFSTEDRIRWAGYAWRYLVTSADESYLADLAFEDDRPLFNPREVAHMADVHRVLQASMRVWAGGVALLLVGAVAAIRIGRLDQVARGVSLGGWFMVAIAGGIAVLVLAGILVNPDVFWNFFAAFHAAFFEGDSWLFENSDTLIRLFPIQFWQDAFLLAAGVAIGGGMAVAVVFRSK